MVDKVPAVQKYSRLKEAGYRENHYSRILLQDTTSGYYFRILLQDTTSGYYFRILLQDTTSGIMTTSGYGPDISDIIIMYVFDCK